MEQATAAVSILLVDDEPLHVDLLEAALRGQGFRLVKAASGSEALKRVEEEEFALIVLDIVMPGMDGFKTAALIRQQKRSQHTPIIFVTARLNTAEKEMAGYRAGAVDYLRKPVEAHVLRAKAAEFARLFKLAAELREENACLEASHRELQQAVTQIGTFRDVLCFCERCKKFLDPSAQWIPLEEYLHIHLGAEVCLGILCPDCAKQSGTQEKNRLAALEA